jgi:hypothetical protein
MSGVVSLSNPALLEFWAERHLCTFTTLRKDGSPHVVAVGATLDPDAGLCRVISSALSAHVRHIRDGAEKVAVCQTARGGPRSRDWPSSGTIPRPSGPAWSSTRPATGSPVPTRSAWSSRSA